MVGASSDDKIQSASSAVHHALTDIQQQRMMALPDDAALELPDSQWAVDPVNAAVRWVASIGYDEQKLFYNLVQHPTPSRQG